MSAGGGLERPSHCAEEKVVMRRQQNKNRKARERKMQKIDGRFSHNAASREQHRWGWEGLLGEGGGGGGRLLIPAGRCRPLSVPPRGGRHTEEAHRFFPPSSLGRTDRAFSLQGDGGYYSKNFSKRS